MLSPTQAILIAAETDVVGATAKASTSKMTPKSL
jgi:hypothetical protein